MIKATKIFLFLLFAGEVSIPLCTTNRINNPETAEGIIAGGKKNHVSFYLLSFSVPKSDRFIHFI